MTYSFSLQPPVSRQIRHLVRQQVQGAIDSLNLAHGPEIVRIHEARKHLKKSRAVLALARKGRSDGVRKLDAALKQVAHKLAPFRDADSLQLVLLQLQRDYEAEHGSQLFEAARTLLEQRNLSQGLVASAFEETVPELIATLRKFLIGSDRWDLPGTTPTSLFKQIRARYGQGRARMRAAMESSDVETIHSWRKAAKDHWYHMRLLKKSWPRLIQARAIDCSTLCDFLGKDHDLGLLLEVIRNGFARDGAEEFKPLLWLMEHERTRIQAQAFSLGRLIFAEKKQALSQRLFSYWKTWRSRS